jgi:hypothetical protein
MNPPSALLTSLIQVTLHFSLIRAALELTTNARAARKSHDKRQVANIQQWIKILDTLDKELSLAVGDRISIQILEHHKEDKQ